MDRNEKTERDPYAYNSLIFRGTCTEEEVQMANEICRMHFEMIHRLRGETWVNMHLLLKKEIYGSSFPEKLARGLQENSTSAIDMLNMVNKECVRRSFGEPTRMLNGGKPGIVFEATHARGFISADPTVSPGNYFLPILVVNELFTEKFGWTADMCGTFGITRSQLLRETEYSSSVHRFIRECAITPISIPIVVYEMECHVLTTVGSFIPVMETVSVLRGPSGIPAYVSSTFLVKEEDNEKAEEKSS